MFNQWLCSHSFWMACFLWVFPVLCVLAHQLCQHYVRKEGREVIDLASAPAPWHWWWETVGWTGGRERENACKCLCNIFKRQLQTTVSFFEFFSSFNLFRIILSFFSLLAPWPHSVSSCPVCSCFSPPCFSVLICQVFCSTSHISSCHVGRDSGFISHSLLCKDGSDAAVESSPLGT